jgi:hypothetical protein
VIASFPRRTRRARGAWRFAALLAGSACLGLPAAAYQVNPILRDAPGYRPAADRDSASVRLGRRLDAPLVDLRFRDGARSLDDLGRRLVHAIHHTSADSLRRLCLTREEFAVVLWREFPESRPATGLTADDAWFLLDGRLRGGVSKILNELGGQHLEFLRWERTAPVRPYKNFRLHNGLVLVVRDEQGQEARLTHVRAVAERHGAFKLQSLRD